MTDSDGYSAYQRMVVRAPALLREFENPGASEANEVEAGSDQMRG